METELQVAQDFKQPYSWVNEALLVEELLERSGRDFSSVAKQMHHKPQRIREIYEKLQQAHQLVALSDGSRLLVDFKEHDSAFNELAKHLRGKGPKERDSVRSVYFLGTLAGVTYRKLRHLRRSDAENLVADQLEESAELSPILETAAQVDGGTQGPERESDPLDDALGEMPSEGRVHKLLKLVAQSREDEPVRLQNGREAELDDVREDIRDAINRAADEAHELTKDAVAISAPVARLDQARRHLVRARALLDRGRSTPGWSEEAFTEKRAEVGVALQALEESD